MYSVSVASFSNTTVTYILDTANGSEVNYQILDEAYTVYENSFNEFTPNLTWSSAGSVSISHCLGRYNNVLVPSWITINSNTGILNIDSPLIISNTDYYFSINSYISNFNSTVQK